MSEVRIEMLDHPEELMLTAAERRQIAGAGPVFVYSGFYPYAPPPVFSYQPAWTAYGPYGPTGYYYRPVVVYPTYGPVYQPWVYGVPGW
jgi:hypothetical protein